MNKTTIKKLRKKLEVETISLKEIMQIEDEFNKIPDEQLRDERDNALVGDMLDELERELASKEVK